MSKPILFTGSGVALVTPMHPDGRINYGKLEELVDCPFYAVEHAMIHGQLVRPGLPLYEMIDVIEGEGTINGTRIQKGDHFVIPHGYGDYTLQGNMEIMLSRP